jgi:arylsulfatase A-like enzyme
VLTACSGQRRSPSVILIVSDALRFDVLGCMGGEADTPHIDSLARRGVLFERAYSTAPSTFPSSIAMLTGMYSRSFMVSGGESGDEELTFYVSQQEELIGEVLRGIGYDVLRDVENGISIRANNAQGFETIGHLNELLPDQIQHVERITGIENIGGHTDRRRSSKYDKLYAPLHYLMTVPETQSFFILKWFSDPHAPYHPPEKFRDKVKFDASLFPKDQEFYSSLYSLNSSRGVTEAEINYLKALYRAEVESVDERVGFILKALEHSGRSKDTIIVFTSDHGEAFGEHDRFLHGNALFEQLVRVPMIIAGPGISKGKRVGTSVSLIDLIPTLYELLKISPPRKLQGESFAPLLKGRSCEGRDIYIDRISNRINAANMSSEALLRGSYKLIVTRRDQKPVLRLYDLENDPGEIRDIAQENPEIVRELFQAVRELRADCDARLEENLAGIDPSLDVGREAQKTRDLLKALGYIK